jgi:hypothetical protein
LRLRIVQSLVQSHTVGTLRIRIWTPLFQLWSPYFFFYYPLVISKIRLFHPWLISRKRWTLFWSSSLGSVHIHLFLLCHSCLVLASGPGNRSWLQGPTYWLLPLFPGLSWAPEPARSTTLWGPCSGFTSWPWEAMARLHTAEFYLLEFSVSGCWVRWCWEEDTLEVAGHLVGGGLEKPIFIFLIPAGHCRGHPISRCHYLGQCPLPFFYFWKPPSLHAKITFINNGMKWL